ncbi:MAG: GNAT family N-acetyltransferase [Asgard group archaeon]|nr:GNAT family N-acetyltransferase [Asgard group archaeon]
MSFKFKDYKHEEDFTRIRDFLIHSYKKIGKPSNWTLERWNYAFFFIRDMFGITLQEWEKSIGIWEDEGGTIVSIVNAEGLNRGEAFFQLKPEDYDVLLLKEMFTFAEENLILEDDDKYILKLRIRDKDVSIEEIAKERGYFKNEKASETTSIISLDRDFSYPDLPEGYSIRSMADKNDVEKRTIVFAKAFGNYGTKDEVQPSSYHELQKAIDYRKDLDIYIESPEGEFVSFCLIWYDEKNKIGILEPVGTDPDYRRKGFAKATNYEAIKRVKEEGAEKVYVGDGQQFYMSIGFKKQSVSNIWIKEIKK